MFWMGLFGLSEERAGSGRRSMHIHTSTIGNWINTSSTHPQVEPQLEPQLDNWKLDQEKKKTKKEEEGTKVSDGREEKAPARSTQGAAARVWGVGERIKGVSILRTERFLEITRRGNCCQD